MVFVSGHINGSYRAQNIMKALSDNNIKWCYLPWYLPYSGRKSIKTIFSLITLIILFPIRFFLIANSKSLVMLPMNFGWLVLLDISIAKICGTKVILEFYISEYDALVNDRKIVNPLSKKAKFLSFIERNITKLADEIICLNNSEADYYQRFMCENAQEKIKIIPLVIDRVKVRDLKFEVTSENFNICWWGTYIPLHGLDKVIEAFSMLKRDNVYLYIFGDSVDKSNDYVEQVNRLGITSNVIFNHSSTFRNGKLPEFLINNCDLALGNFGDSEKAKTVLVNKIVDTLALSIPCLSMETGACNEFLEDGKNIYLTESSPTPKQILMKIEFILNNKEQLKELGRRGYDIYNENFSPEVFSERYIKNLR
ncbi:glycosyltransferase [Vibrio celticus]|uniref:Glycosyl transferases group 1 n=1 Tax=Vibrio celticus TaxID=446372 RepID=A0A1C3J9C3_9VIBR|nr:glycosyltransferase [Vibrio celticus]SBT11695.1 Glycosyl transferases group 1 [Vibrio celticus]